MQFKTIPIVHPRVIELSRAPRAYAISIGEQADCGAGGQEVFAADPEMLFGPGAEPFGVKRPLRFLAYKLQLTNPQVSELAAILDELKIERAQASVDDRRTHAVFAEAVSGEQFDETKAAEGARVREQSTDRLGLAVVKALGRIHKLLTPGQRERFAYMIRTGTIRL